MSDNFNNLNNFDEALRFTLYWEGGYVNHPSDPGGPTNQGITQRTYDSYRSSLNLVKNDVRNITHKEVREIYFSRYWKASKADRMTAPLAIAHFDTCVNFNVRDGVKFLQEALGFTGRDVDGIFGPITAGALKSNNNKATAMKLVEGRIAYRHKRVAKNPSQKVFLSGWLNRDLALKKFIGKL